MKIKREKKNRADGEKKLRTIRMRYGSYRLAITAVILAILVVINLLAAQLPSKYTNIDISKNSYYSIGEMTESIVGNLSEDITIYVLAEESSADSVVEEMLSRYQDLSDHIKVEHVDPAVNPGFAQNYHASDASAGSLIVVSDKRYTVVDLSDIYQTDYDYESYYTTGQVSYTQSFDGENLVTSAIDYVTTDQLPVMYTLTGHGEQSLPSDVQTQVERLNVQTESLNLLTTESVPEDASALLIYCPSKDLSDSEKEAILSYMQQGGSVLYVPVLSVEAQPNLDALLSEYGMTLTHSLILEGDSSAYYQSPAQLVPEVKSHTITSPIVDSGLSLLVYEPQGIRVADDLKDGLTVTSLVNTTEDAYGKSIDGGQISSIDREDDDEAGPFSLAAIAEESISSLNTDENMAESTDETDENIAESADETDENIAESTDENAAEKTEETEETETSDSEEEVSRLIVISSEYLLNEQLNKTFTIANEDLFLNSVSYLCGHESTISIASKSMENPTVTMTSMQVSIWRVVSMYLVPGALLAGGIVVFIRRRKK